MTKFINSLDQFRGQEGKLFCIKEYIDPINPIDPPTVENTIARLTLNTDNAAIFQALDRKNSDYYGAGKLYAEDLEGILSKGGSVKTISNTVYYGDLRNLEKDSELKKLFDQFVSGIYQTYESGQAEYYLNHDSEFREARKNIRKGPLYFDQAKKFFNSAKLEN